MRKLFFLLFLPLFGVAQTADSNFFHVYHPKRFKLITSDTVIGGIVKKVINEQDGDWHIIFEDDSITAECICQRVPRVFDAKVACDGYKEKFKRPKKGQRIIISGPYVFDRHHKVYEIHPVKVLIITK